MRNKEIEIKANWNRVRKVEGLDATNIKINSKRNPIVDVDPFAPPVLTLHKQNTASKPLALPSSSQAQKIGKPEPKTVDAEKRQVKSAIVKTNSVFKKIESESSESKKEPSRPKTASRTKPKRKKSKSSSPKRVHISNDPIDLPRKDQLESNQNGQIQGSFSQSKRVNNQDVGSSIEFSFNKNKSNINDNLEGDEDDIEDEVNFEDENVFEILD